MLYNPKEIYKIIDENKRLKNKIDRMQKGILEALPLIKEKIVTKEIIKDCNHLKIIHALENKIDVAKKKNSDAIIKLEHILNEFEGTQQLHIQNHIKQLKLLF